MADGFDYGSLWENARDTLDVLDVLDNAMLQLLTLRGPWHDPQLPPAFQRSKRLKPADYAERRKRAIKTIRKTASHFLALLAEDRFVEPLANVWPPSAPKKLTSEFSYALVSARSFCFAAHDSDEEKLLNQKQNLYLARTWVETVLRELERDRPDLAERAYQRARSKLRRQVVSHPDTIRTATVQHEPTVRTPVASPALTEATVSDGDSFARLPANGPVDPDGQPEEAEQPKVDDQPDAPVEDGPIKPDGFTWNGTVYSGLARKPFLAVQFLWREPNRSANTDDLAEPVWEDHGTLPDEEAVSGLRREINTFFRRHDISFHAKVKTRCLSLCDGPPRPSKKCAVAKKRRNRSH